MDKEITITRLYLATWYLPYLSLVILVLFVFASIAGVLRSKRLAILHLEGHDEKNTQKN